MSREIDKPNTNETTAQPQTEGIDNSRRLITKAGLIVAPVILTVTSRPVLGGGSYDGGSYSGGSYGSKDGGGSYGDKTGGGDYGGKGKCTLSGFMSGNLSRPGDSNCVCKDEYSKKHWKTHKDKWSNSDCSPGKIQWIKNNCDNSYEKPKVCWGGKDSSGREATKCEEKFGYGSGHDGEKMMDILWKAEYDKSCELMAHAITAYCNASSYSEYGLSCNDVVDKYKKACAGTYKNYFTEHEGLDCKEALKKEFKFLNCEDTAPDYPFDCDDSTHWDSSTSCHHDYQEYKKCKYIDKWSSWSSKECNEHKEYKGWKYSNTSYTTYSSDYSKYCNTYKTGDGWSGGGGSWGGGGSGW